jgi:hypothetical protein
MSNNQGLRKEKYSRLRKVGFASKFCNRAKDFSNDTVEALILIREEYNKRKTEVYKNAKKED